MTFDSSSIRSDFPSLSTGIAHFDGPGGSQAPTAVGAAIASTLSGPLSNRGFATASESNAETAIVEFRNAIGDLVNADPRGVVYGRSATQLAYDFSRHLSRGWNEGDEVIVTRLDHDSNIRPWVQAAERSGAVVRWVDFDPETTELSIASLQDALSEKTKLVAVTGASNLLGTQPPIAQISQLAHDVGALTYVDGVHFAAHSPIDVQAMGADFFVCSPYKFMGPHCAALSADPSLLESLELDKLLPSTNEVPERFEFGTLPYEIMAGATAAINYIADLDPGAATTRRERIVASMESVEHFEDGLRVAIEEGLKDIPGIVVHSKANRRTPTLLLSIAGRKPEDAYRFLAANGVLAPAGSFYAIEAATRLGLGSQGGLRVGLAPYNNGEDVQKLLSTLKLFVDKN
jgi:cysteine desulfurase family protein (TIGR01976 family)